MAVQVPVQADEEHCICVYSGATLKGSHCLGEGGGQNNTQLGTDAMEIILHKALLRKKCLGR